MSDEQERRGISVTPTAQWIVAAAVGASITCIGRIYMHKLRILGPPDPDPMGWLIFFYFPGLLLGGVISGTIGRCLRLVGLPVKPGSWINDMYLFGNVMNFVFYTLIVYFVIRWWRRRVS